MSGNPGPNVNINPVAAIRMGRTGGHPEARRAALGA